LHHLTRLQETLIWSLLDLAVAVAWNCWPRVTEWWDRPVLSLDRSRLQRGRSGLIAALVSRPAMEQRLCLALSERTHLRFAATWDELQWIVARMSPSTVFADPLADAAGDAEGHLARLSSKRRVPVVLYTVLTPAVAGSLLRLSGCGIHHVVFHRYDDNPARLREVCEWGPSEPPLRAA
jgi:hypothetical protein